MVLTIHVRQGLCFLSEQEMQVLVLTLNQIIAVDDITRDIDCPKNKPENFGAL